MPRRSSKGLLTRHPVAGGLLFGVVFFMALPLTLPIALYQHQRTLRRMRKAAVNFVCVRCGATLGVQALQLGETRWQEILRQRDKAWLRLRIVRDLHAVCVACGAEYAYDETHATFLLRARQAA